MDSKKRENTILIVGIITLIFTYYFIFASPTLNSIKKEKKKIVNNEKNISKLTTLLENHKKNKTVNKKYLQGSLSAFVENKAKEIGITIAFIRPYGSKIEGVEIKVDEMEGEKILELLYEMENNGVKISRINMRDYKGTGIWVVKMNLEKLGSKS